MATFMLVRMPHITCSRGWLTAHGQLPLCFVFSLMLLLAGPALCRKLLLGSIEYLLPKGPKQEGGKTLKHPYTTLLCVCVLHMQLLHVLFLSFVSV